MRWFQSLLLRFVEPVLLVMLSLWFDSVKMTILPLPLFSPLRERTFFGDSFRELLALLLGDFFHPRQATPSICMIAMQWHGFFIKTCLKYCVSYVWFVHGISRSIVWSWYCHDIAWSSRTYILMIMWMTCAFGFLVAIMIIFLMVPGIILEYYFGYHAAFGLLVVSMIIFMMLVDVLLLLLGVLILEMMFTCGS